MNAAPARKATTSRQAKSASSAHVPERETGTVRRVLLLLSHLVDNPGISVNAIAGKLNLPRSTVHRMLTMLKAEDFASQESDGSFSAGVEMYRLAGRLKANVPYAKFAEPLLAASIESVQGNIDPGDPAARAAEDVLRGYRVPR